MDKSNTFSPISADDSHTDDDSQSDSSQSQSGSDTEVEDDISVEDTISDINTNSLEPAVPQSVQDLPDISNILDYLLDGQLSQMSAITDISQTTSQVFGQFPADNNYPSHATSRPTDKGSAGEPLTDTSLASYLKDIDNSWLSPSQWIEDMKHEFATLNRRGYDFESVEFVDTPDGQLLTGSDKLKAFQEEKCFKCNKYPCDPKWCAHCCQVYCRICILESIINSENCGQNLQHMSRDLTPEEYVKRFSRVRVRCEYGCLDSDQCPVLFSQYSLGDTHNRGRECPHRKCTDCRMWRTGIEPPNGPDNCFLNHFSRFSAFIDIKLQLYFNQMCSQFQKQMQPMTDPMTPLMAMQYEHGDITKPNIDQLKYQLSEKELVLHSANDRIVELTRQLEQAKEIIMSKDRFLNMLDRTRGTKRSKMEQTHTYSPQWSVRCQTRDIKLAVNPSDDNPKVTENYVQVIHPKHGIKRINGIQDNMTWDQLKHHIVSQFNNEFGHPAHYGQESYEDYDLVSLRMRVEAGDKTIGGFYYPTMIFNLVPTGLLERGTAYQMAVKEISALHRPSDLAKRVGIIRNSLVKNRDTTRTRKRKWNNTKLIMPFWSDEAKFKSYLAQLVDQRIRSHKHQETNYDSRPKTQTLESDADDGH